MDVLSQLILINSILFYLGSFEKQCDIPVCLLNSDLFYLIVSCWDNVVLHAERRLRGDQRKKLTLGEQIGRCVLMLIK